MAKKYNKKQWQTADGTKWDELGPATLYALKRNQAPPIEVKPEAKKLNIKK